MKPECPDERDRRCGRDISALAVCLVLLAIVFPCGRYCSGKDPSGTSPLSVLLTVAEPSGIDRVQEPVTSGIPLPQGSVKETIYLRLTNRDSVETVPCQFTVLSRWPDGTVKWVLLDFFCTVKAKGSVEYILCANAPSEPPEAKQGPFRHAVKVHEDDEVVYLDTGTLHLALSKKKGTVIETAAVSGKTLIAGDKPCDAVLKLEDGSLYRTSLCTPDHVSVESKGPLRARVRARGKFVNADGKGIFGDRIRYDLRVTVYAGKPFVNIGFTLENQGRLFHRREWLRFKSLVLDVPVLDGNSSPRNHEASRFDTENIRTPDPFWEMLSADGTLPVTEKDHVSLTQWFKYPIKNNLGWEHASSGPDRAREELAGMKDDHRGFYYLLKRGDNVEKKGKKTAGWISLLADRKQVLGACVRRFWQNFPRGFEVRPGTLSVLLWPEGGCWPRSDYIAEKVVYQFDSNRFKTAEVLLSFGGEPQECSTLLYAVDAPLFARAPLSWYRDTDAVWPLAGAGLHTSDGQANEAISRYDRLQQAKIYKEIGDSAGPLVMGEGIMIEDMWGKVSIPDLRNRYPEIYFGFMSFGDLVWAHGFCSLFYDYPYGMLIQHLRFKDETMFEIAEDMVRHRYDIDRGGGWQRYEKGYHGHSARILRDKYRKRGGFRPHPSHTWCRGLFLHWVLTGNPRSLETAKQNAQAFSGILGKREGPVIYPEFRVPVWAIDACLAMHEYGGDVEYLEKALEIFNRTLLAMEQKNGSCGHIMPEGHQSTQFVAYMIEPIARLHHLTKRREVAEFLKRVLDWHRQAGTLYGKMEGDKYCPLEFVSNWKMAKEDSSAAFATSRVYGFMFADGYAYLYHVFGEERDLEFARKVFRDTMFYYGVTGLRINPHARTPLGYHFMGDPIDMCAKVHAFSTRYDQLYLHVEQKVSSGNLRALE